MHLYILNLIYNPKVKAIMDDINLFYYVDEQVMQLKNFVDKILKEKTKISQQIKIHHNELKTRAVENNKLALKLLKKKNFSMLQVYGEKIYILKKSNL